MRRYRKLRRERRVLRVKLEKLIKGGHYGNAVRHHLSAHSVPHSHSREEHAVLSVRALWSDEQPIVSQR